jgi:hypothetical protein
LTRQTKSSVYCVGIGQLIACRCPRNFLDDHGFVTIDGPHRVQQKHQKLPERDEFVTPEIYNALAQNFAQIRSHGSTLVVRGSGPTQALVGAIRRAVREVSPGQALFRVATMQQVIEESLANPRLYMWLLALFAGMGTLLAGAGIYGVIAFLVALRTRAACRGW